MSSTFRWTREILNLVYLARSRGDLGVIAILARFWAHVQHQKSKFAPFPFDGELHVDDSLCDPAHGSRYVTNAIVNFIILRLQSAFV